MRTTAVVFALFVLAIGFAAPIAVAQPPDLPRDGGCGGFHWHNGNVREGQLPAYHYHHCY